MEARVVTRREAAPFQASEQRLNEDREQLREPLLGTALLPARIGDLVAVLLVLGESSLHPRAEVAIVEGQAVLVVLEQRAGVEVDRADGAENTVDDRVLVVHHRALVLQD